MALEPLSSAMTYQAQDVVKTSAQSAPSANTEVTPEDQTVNVDATTSSVNQTQEKNNEDGKGANNGGDEDNAPQQPKKSQMASEQLKKAIAEMNRKINNSHEEAVFGVHEDTNRIMIKIVDKDTKEIIKEFPPEKTLDMIAKVWEMAGILVDEKG